MGENFSSSWYTPVWYTCLCLMSLVIQFVRDQILLQPALATIKPLDAILEFKDNRDFTIVTKSVIDVEFEHNKGV